MWSDMGCSSRPVNRRRSGIRLASVPPQRVAQNVTARQQVLAVLSTSPEGMALRDPRKELGEGLPEWELKKWTASLGCIPI